LKKKTKLLIKYVQARLSHRRLRVVRIETTVDNKRIVGLLVPNAAVETVLQGSLSNTFLFVNNIFIDNLLSK